MLFRSFYDIFHIKLRATIRQHQHHVRPSRAPRQYLLSLLPHILTPSQKSLSSGSSPPVQQFATFKAAESYQHIPTPALEPSDVLFSLLGPAARNGPAGPVRAPGRQRDRSVDIFEKHALTKPRVDVEGQQFTFKTGAAAEFEKPVIEEKTIKILDLPLGRRRRSEERRVGKECPV